MSLKHKTLFISDLHLDETDPETTQKFFQFLNYCDQSIDALYILGDLFEAWIGDDYQTEFNISIIQALKKKTESGLAIYFMKGNRDFLIGKSFLRATGCTLLPDYFKLNLYQHQVLLLHGDTLCTQDAAYLKWRRKARNPILHTLFFLSLPLRWRIAFAKKMRAKSAMHTKNIRPEIMDVTTSEVERIMQEYNVSHLIHGHTHRPAFHTVTLGEKIGKRMVLGAWHDGPNVLVWEQDGEQKLVGLEYFQ